MTRRNRLLLNVAVGTLVVCGRAAAGGFVLASERAGTTVAKIDGATDQIVGRATIGAVPSAMTLDPVRRWVYVSANLGDKIVAVNADTLAAADVAVPGLGRQPIGVALTPDHGRLLVATRGTDGVVSADDRLDIVQLNTSAWPPTGSIVASVPTGLHPVGVCIDHTGRYAVVTVRNQPAILIVDLQVYQVVGQAANLPAGAEPEGCDIHPTANIVYVTLHGTMSTIEVFDLDTLTHTKHVPIVYAPPARPSGGTFTPDGRRFYVSGQTVKKVFLFDTSDPYNPVQDMSVQLAVGPQPHAIAYLPGQRAYVANTNNEQPLGSVSVIHDYSGTPTVSRPILTTLAGPLDLVWVPALAPGDLNCDGRVTFADIDLFVEALSGESAWTHWPCPWINGDCNGDGLVTFADIDPFVTRIGTTAP